MLTCRLHILGASGTGTATLARAKADVWLVPRQDTDDHFWQPAEPLYRDMQDSTGRPALMQLFFAPRMGLVGQHDRLG